MPGRLPSPGGREGEPGHAVVVCPTCPHSRNLGRRCLSSTVTRARSRARPRMCGCCRLVRATGRSEEHTSELQSRGHLVCRLLLEKKKRSNPHIDSTAV